jgi:hypothetical protein
MPVAAQTALKVVAPSERRRRRESTGDREIRFDRSRDDNLYVCFSQLL